MSILNMTMDNAIKISFCIMIIAIVFATITMAIKEQDKLLKNFAFGLGYALFFGCILLGALIYNSGFVFLMSVIGFIIATFITKKIIYRNER